jgi:AraC-like DNA-binding protein
MDTQQEAKLAYLGFRLISPSPLLRGYVRSYWFFQRELPLLDYHDEYMHARGGYGIVFNFGDGLRLDMQPITETIFLDGTITVSRKMGFTGNVEVMGISFCTGGAFPFLAIPLAELRNEISLLDVYDKPTLMELYARLYDAESLAARVDLLDQWLLGRLSVAHDLGKVRHPIIPASLEIVKQVDGRLSIPALADHFAISQRQLERLYQSQVGMSPKQYARLLRVQSAREALKTMANQSTTDLALEYGFYDQSHFIREFSAVVGMSPGSYVERSKLRG